VTRVDASDYTRLAGKLRDADKAIAKQVRAELADAAKPFGEEVIRDGSDGMPRRGGLRELLQQGGRVSLRMRSDGVDIALQNRDGVQLGPLNKGSLRHPVFARAGMSSREAGALVDDAVRSTGGRLKYGRRRAVSRVRNAGRVWRTQTVTADTYTKAAEQRMDKVRPRVEQAIENALKELT